MTQSGSSVFGRQAGRYFLLDRLGEGGMAAVYEAHDSFLERSVALKMILPSRQATSGMLERFAMEAHALAKISHKNIVKVLDYGEENGTPFLVMEFMEGGTLREVCGKPMPWMYAAEILAPVARALEFIHDHNIVHRDVKPSNILMDENDQPMLTDFGIIKLLETTETDLLATNVGIGTPEYMSPEQAMGREVDFRADIYSLGVVFYELLTGEKPYSAESPMAVSIKHVTGTFPRPGRLVKKLPWYVEAVLMKAVAKDPARRYPDMGIFADALEALAQGGKDLPKRIRRILRAKTSLRKRKRPRRLPAWAVLLVILGVLGGLGAAGWFFRDALARTIFWPYLVTAWQAVADTAGYLWSIRAR